MLNRMVAMAQNLLHIHANLKWFNEPLGNKYIQTSFMSQSKQAAGK